MKFFKLFFKKTLRYLLKPLSFAPAIIIMLLIYRFSAQDGAASSNISFSFTTKLVSFYNEHMHKGYSAAQIMLYSRAMEFYVRKFAHIFEYFCLGISVALPLYIYRIRGIWLFLTSGIICMGFAFLDEYHQSFVMGRSSSLRDVAIDCIGIFPGIILCHLICYIGRKTIFAPLSMEKERAAKKEYEKRQRAAMN